jgi:hypothetical protein
MKRMTIAIIALSLLIGLFSIYIGIQGLYNVAQVENINQMFAEDEEVDLEELYYYHESIKGTSGVISKIAWTITVLTSINTGLAFYGFFKSKNIYRK